MLDLNFSGIELEAGCDEAGRGCLAGPVFAAAVILPAGFDVTGINDSKQLSEKQRNYWRTVIEKDAIAWAVATCTPKQIDKINILNASILAMHKALNKLLIRPEFVIVDGNRFKKWKKVPHETIIKGDGKYASIAAAGILAKTHRDEFMNKMHKKNPEYNWIQNAGYPTLEHRKAIAAFGPTVHHRMTFRLLKEELD